MSYNPGDLLLALDLAAEHVKSVSYSSPAARTVAVLAAAVTHVPLAFSHVPRVFITGPYGSGKSTFLSALAPLVQNVIRNSGQLSSTFAYRNDFRDGSVDGEVPTSFVDETKHIFGDTGKKGSQHPLYAIATEGYSRTGAPIKYQEKDLNVQYSCYQVMFLASRGAQALPEDVLQRAITLELSQKPNGLQLASVTDPSVIADGVQYGQFLRSAIRAAEQSLRITARDTDWFTQHGLDNRTADVWIPLFTIAETAGGSWPALVASAYAELGSKTSRNLPTQFQLRVDVLGFMQLADCTPDHIPARELIEYLMELGRNAYTWDNAPFTLKRFGMTLAATGVQGWASNSKRWYRVTDAWLRQAEQIAHPIAAEPADPENDWEAFESAFFAASTDYLGEYRLFR